MNITIIGLGWLGSALALDLIGEGYHVNGSTTTTSKINAFELNGVKTSHFKLGETIPEVLLDCDVLIFTIPPIGTNYVNYLKDFSHHIKHNTQVIYISSTSVYPNTNKKVGEAEAKAIPSPHTGISLLDAENAFTPNNATILRFAGLMGPERHPGKFLVGKANITGGDNPINIIHRDDCIGLIKSVIENALKGEVINGCADFHPLKKEFYTRASELLSLEPPTFSAEKQSFKVIDNEKSKSLLRYQYKFPDPLKALELI